MATSETLTEALASLGITHARLASTITTGRRRLTDATGTVLGEFDAEEGWALVHRLRIAEAA